jgi:hypothetical protein
MIINEITREMFEEYKDIQAIKDNGMLLLETIMN